MGGTSASEERKDHGKVTLKHLLIYLKKLKLELCLTLFVKINYKQV